MSSLTDTLIDAAFGSDQKAFPASLGRGGAGMVFGHATGGISGGRFSASSARKQLEAYAGKGGLPIDWIMAGLNLITDTAISAEWYLEGSDGKKIPSHKTDAAVYERTAPSDLVDLLERPNPWMDWAELVTLTLIDEILTGDAFWLLYGKDFEGKPAAIYRLSPALIEVIPSDKDFIKSYRYSVPGMTPVEFAPEDVLQFRSPNPHDPYRGAGIIAGGPRTFDMEVAISDAKASYMERGAQLSGVLETERSMNDGLLAKIRRQFIGQYAGAARSGEIAILERGMKFNPISSSAKDAEFAALSDASRDRILALLRIPTSLLGLASGNSNVSGAIEDDRRTFSNSTMRPLLDRLERKISRGLTEPGWGLKFCIEYEYQMPIEEQIALGEKKATLPGITVREVRASVNLPPLQEVLEDKTEAKKIEEMVLNLPGENDNESEVKDQPLGSEKGRKPLPENTRPIKPGKQPADAKVGNS